MTVRPAKPFLSSVEPESESLPQAAQIRSFIEKASPESIVPTVKNAAVAVAAGEGRALMVIPKRRGRRETLDKSLSIRCTPSTFKRFDAFCEEKDVSYSQALVLLLDLAQSEQP